MPGDVVRFESCGRSRVFRDSGTGCAAAVCLKRPQVQGMIDPCGIDTVRHVKGSWALCFWDPVEIQTLLGSRTTVTAALEATRACAVSAAAAAARASRNMAPQMHGDPNWTWSVCAAGQLDLEGVWPKAQIVVCPAS